MNNKFLLVDRINGSQKVATYILLFQSGNDKYLIYYLDENNNNKQIFVSKLIRNTEGKYFISDINSNDKNRINGIVYNIVIVLPVSNNNSVIEDFENKYNIIISLEPVNIETQNYLHNSRVAITSEMLVNNCIEFYNKNINNDQINVAQNDSQIQIKNITDISTIPNQNNNVVDNTSISTTNEISSQVNDDSINNQLPNINPQMQILENNVNTIPIQNAVNSDINMSGINEKNNNNNNEGFVINTSIIVGTIALLLAVAIVTFTFIVIKKMII